MKASRIQSHFATVIILLFFILQVHTISSQINIYGTTDDEFLNKVIPDAQGYYALGSDDQHAVVARFNTNGQWLWTHKLDIMSGLTDGIVTSSGHLLFVGLTLPLNSSNESIIGEMDVNGQLSCLNKYNGPGMEAVGSIRKNATGGMYSALGFHTSTLADVVLFTISSSGGGCAVVNKKQFDGAGLDDFAYNLDILQTGELAVCGKDASNNAVIYQMDPVTNAFITGVQGPNQYIYVDIEVVGTDILAAATPRLPGFKPHIMRFDHDFIPLWEAEVNGIEDIQQIFTDSGGLIYIVGTTTIAGVSRTVIQKFDDNLGTTFPIPLWSLGRYLDNTASTYLGGHYSAVNTNKLVYAEGRTYANGFGMNDYYFGITDGNLTSACAFETPVDLSPTSTLFNGPCCPTLNFYDVPPSSTIPTSFVDWDTLSVCGASCAAEFTFLTDCGDVSFTDHSTLPFVPSWVWTFQNGNPSSSTSQNPFVTFPGCGTYNVCLTATGTGPFSACSNTICHNVVIVDNIPPVVICTGVGLELDANCQAMITPQLIDGGSFDNCQIASMSVSPSVIHGCGEFPVVLTVSDWCGNTSTCATLVQVAEDIPPVIVCPANMTVVASGQSPCSKVVNGIKWLVASDNCSGVNINYNVSGVTTASGQNDASGINFHEGVSTIVYTAIDDCGNTSTCSFTVTVNCGTSMTNGCARMVATCYSPAANQPVAVIYDPSFNTSSAPVGNDWVNVPTVYPPSWTRAGIGNVFGIALDHMIGDVYLSATDVYNYDAFLNISFHLVTAAGPGGSAGVYKTNIATPNTTTPIVFTAQTSGLTAYNTGNMLPNKGGFGNGIGNIVYDAIHQQLFLTNLEDGRIYRISPSGNLLSAFDPFTLDSRVNGLEEKPEERLWGIGVYNNRVYFAREESLANSKQIWSIGLDGTGNFAAISQVPGFPGLWRGNEVLELSPIPGAEEKITDIEFASDGRMLLAERGYAHTASVFEYELSNGTWISTNVPHNVGYGSGRNSAGGVDYGYVEKNGIPTAICDGIVWATGNCLNTAAIPGLCDVYGIEGLSSAGNAPDPSNGATDIFIDFNHTYGSDQKYQVGDVDLFKCGCPPHSSVCDSVNVTSSVSPEVLDSCCFILTLHNQKLNYFTGIQLCTSNGVSISTVASLNGWTLDGYSAQFLSLVPPGPSGSLAPGGNYNFIKFCLSNYLNVPNQQVMVKYFGPDETIVCVDTLNFNCSKKPKCIKVTDTVECAANGKYKMSFCIMSNALIGWNVNSVQLNPPPGITFTPSVFSVNNLMPGQMQCGFMTLISGAVDGQTICYSITAHKDDISTNPNVNPTTCCTDTLMLGCVTMPECICNNLSASATEVDQMGDTCCWKISLSNGYSNTLFTGVQLDILGGVVFGAIVNPLGSGWSSASTPTQAIFKPKPVGSFIGATGVLPIFCLSGINSSSQVPQQIVLSWLGPNETVICKDTIDLDCEPPVHIPCAALINPDIHCDPNAPGTYIFTFQVKNNSANGNNTGFNANQIVLNPIFPPLSISPSQFIIPSLPPAGISAVQTATIIGVQAYQSVCFNLSIHQASNGSDLNCCTNAQQYCFTIPSCPCDTIISAVGLTGYFPFVTNAQDLSPTGIPGFVNGPSTVAGHDNFPNSAYHFNGTSNGIDLTTDNRNISNEVSIVAWVKTSELQLGQWVAGKYSFPELKGYGLSIGDNTNQNIGHVAFGGRDGTGGYYSSGFSIDTVNDGNWHCIIGTAGNNLWKVYVDGALRQSAAGGTNNLATSLNERFTIGYHTDPTKPLWMNGDIDNVLIYNRVLADDEIECLCSGTLPDIEYCDCGAVNNPIPNQIANGSFESGYSGFSTSLAPNIPCGWSSYVIAKNANLKCSTWPSFYDHTTGSGNFMVIDGNPTYASNIWNEPVYVVPGMTYCFSYWTASIYSSSKQYFDLDVIIQGNDGFNNTSKPIGTSTISETFLPGQITPTWIKHAVIWTCPNNFYGPYTIIINQKPSAFGDDYSDFGIDDICFTKFTKPDSCCANIDYFNSLVAQGFTFTQNGCDVTVCSPQFDSCHYFGMEPTFGDGIPVPAVVVPANGCWSHTYTQSGSYTICATVYEDTCWSKVMCTTVNVICDPSGCTCPANPLVSNPSFELGVSGFPNGQNQIGQSTDWFSSNGGVTSIGDWFSYPTPYFPGFYLDPNQGPLELRAHCGTKYAGIDLSTCEGISTAFTTPIPAGNTYNVGFYWSISQPVTSPFNFHAIMSGGNCNVNLTGSNTCTHTCGGDFHIVVPVTSLNLPGVWYYQSSTGIAPNLGSSSLFTIKNITFAGMLGQQAVDNYLFIDDVCVTSTPPDMCECRDADNLVLADGNNQIPTVPFNAVPISLSCDSTGNGIFTLFGEPHCAGDSCLGSDFSWIITDSSGFIVRLGTQPLSGYTGGNSGFFALQAPKSAFTPGIIYTITITTYCGTKACPISVQFVIDCDLCKCGTYTDLNWRPSQGAPNQEIHCGDFLTLGCLPPGFNIMFGGNFTCIGDSCPPSSINWGIRKAGTQTYLVSTSSITGPGFNFAIPGTYFSNPGVYELFIVGDCNNKFCPPCMFTITSLGCPCKCDLFDKIKLVNKKSGTNQNISCGNNPPIVLNCPPVSQPYKITGKLNCDPTSCKGSNLHWELKTGSTVAASGNQLGPWFSITLDNYSLAGLNGLYELVLTGKCGNDTCTCVLRFDISGCPVEPVCPCDNQFYNNVALGFSYGWDSASGGCSWKFTPKVTQCDSVFWEVTGPNGFAKSGSKIGNQAFTATFPDGTFDTYKVTMKVHRPGTNCWQTYCTYVTLDCLITGGLLGKCENNEIDNSGFNENSIAGILGHGGITQGWTSRSGSPQLMDGNGCGDPFSIQLAGRCVKEEVDIIDYPIFIPTGSPGFKFSACYWASQEELRPGTQLVLRISDFPQETAECSDFCQEVARIPIDLPSGEEWKSIATSFLLNGVSGNKYLTLHIENDLIDDELDANSNVWFDNICFEQNDWTTVPTFEIKTESELVRIYPNPNNGEFTLELPSPADHDVRIRIIGLTGQLQYEKQAEAGSSIQRMEINYLPEGMYFVQILSDDGVMGVSRFVKQ
ncbi:MAG: LamG-like jellyroll fold domain-containing protein [Saprospiraceae bacterium]